MGCKIKIFVLLLTVVLFASSFGFRAAPVKAVVSPRTIIVPDDFPTIQGAIDNASAGDTVYVRSGIYNITTGGYFTGILHGFVSLFIGKSISFIGENCQSTVITAFQDYPNPFGCGIVVRTNNVTISGFTIISNKNVIGLGPNNTLTNNIIELNSTGNGFVAISAADSDIISSNIIEGGGHGNTLFNGTSGILTDNNMTISNNIIRDFETGISLTNYSYNQRICKNTFVNNALGLSLLTAPNLFYDNNIENCSEYSLYLGTSGSVNATYNYWGTTNQTAIGNSIYDSKNDSSLGTVDFKPYLEKPNAQALPFPTPSPTTIDFPSTVILPLIILFGVTVAVVLVLRNGKIFQKLRHKTTYL
jgi:hypothetical protein